MPTTYFDGFTARQHGSTKKNFASGATNFPNPPSKSWLTPHVVSRSCLSGPPTFQMLPPPVVQFAYPFPIPTTCPLALKVSKWFISTINVSAARQHKTICDAKWELA